MKQQAPGLTPRRSCVSRAYFPHPGPCVLTYSPTENCTGSRFRTDFDPRRPSFSLGYEAQGVRTGLKVPKDARGVRASVALGVVVGAVG